MKSFEIPRPDVLRSTAAGLATVRLAKATCATALCWCALGHAAEVVVRDLAPAPTSGQGAAQSESGTENADEVIERALTDLGSAGGTGAQGAGTRRPGAGQAARPAAAASSRAAARAAAAAATANTTTTAASAVTGRKPASRPGVSASRVDMPGVERVVFDRLPVKVGLPVGRERLVTLPSPVALHVPDDIDQVARIESIDRTLYITALVPFTRIRIVAETIEGGQQIPLDLLADDSTAAASAQLEIFLKTDEATSTAAAAASGTEAREVAAPAALDMVQLTRFAAQALYAPRRLMPTLAQVQPMPVAGAELPHLIRGVRVQAVPLGQWRSGSLYVTAVRVTNRAGVPVELPLDDLRGVWIAVTAQHGRLGPAGSDTDTTAVYLVCDRAFDACL